MRGRDYGLRGESEGHQEFLQGTDALSDPFQVPVLDCVGHLAEVGPDGEVAALVANDEPDYFVLLQRF